MRFQWGTLLKERSKRLGIVGFLDTNWKVRVVKYTYVKGCSFIVGSQ